MKPFLPQAALGQLSVTEWKPRQSVSQPHGHGQKLVCVVLCTREGENGILITFLAVSLLRVITFIHIKVQSLPMHVLAFLFCFFFLESIHSWVLYV